MFDAVFDIKHPVYAIYNVFDFAGHKERMRAKHPEWSKRQIENCLYWQGTARKELRAHVEAFRFASGHREYSISYCPEAMGVDVTATMQKAGIHLEWPPVSVTYQIAMAGIKFKSPFYS